MKERKAKKGEGDVRNGKQKRKATEEIESAYGRDHSLEVDVAYDGGEKMVGQLPRAGRRQHGKNEHEFGHPDRGGFGPVGDVANQSLHRGVRSSRRQTNGAARLGDLYGACRRKED